MITGEKLWSEPHLIPKISWSKKFKRQVRTADINERKIPMEDRTGNHV